MSVAEIVVRVDQLRGQLGLTRTAGTSAASGARFAATLNSVQGAGSTAGASTGADAVASAKKYLGVPYVWGGTDPAKGLDCSGLMLRAYGDLGVKLPRTAAEQARTGTAVPNLAAAKPGDLLAFNSPVDHIAMYIGDGMMIAAPKPGDKVKIEKVYQTPSTIRRVLPEAAAASGLPTMGLQPANLRAATTANTVSGVPYADLFNAAGARYGVSPKLLAAVAKVESGYNPRAVSNSGAQGLMQIMPGTAKGLGVTNAFDPAQAVDGAAKLLARNLRDFGSVDLAVAAYNAGGGAVRKYHGIPPYAQTQAYVPKVKAALAALGGGS